jgi:hypothetical protein
VSFLSCYLLSAGQGKSISYFISAAMQLHYDLGEENVAKRIEATVIEMLNHGE